MNIKRNISFSLEHRNKNGVQIVENVPIRMRVTYACQRVEFTTGYRIDVAKWDIARQRVKNGCTNKQKQSASEINADLQNYFVEIQNIFEKFEELGITPTIEQLKDVFNMRIKGAGKESLRHVSNPRTKGVEERQQKDAPNIRTKDADDEQLENARKSFWKAYDDFVTDSGEQNNWAARTFMSFSSMKNNLQSFREDLTFEYFDEAGLREFVKYLRDKRDMRNSSIRRRIGYLKEFLRWSFKKGYHHNNAFEMFKSKLKTTAKKVIFLTKDELDKLRECQIPQSKQYLERVRDVFLFCCFTGLRYSDVRNLKRSDVKADHIEVTTVKTADSLIIELNDHSKAILDKYKDIPFENHAALPVISNQKMNDWLKELGELAGIDELIRETYYKGNERKDVVLPKYALLGTHAGRRTFICNALALGIPAQVVMKWTGHSDYKAMKPYIDVADDYKANAMSKFNQL